MESTCIKGKMESVPLVDIIAEGLQWQFDMQPGKASTTAKKLLRSVGMEHSSVVKQKGKFTLDNPGKPPAQVCHKYKIPDGSTINAFQLTQGMVDGKEAVPKWALLSREKDGRLMVGMSEGMGVFWKNECKPGDYLIEQGYVGFSTDGYSSEVKVFPAAMFESACVRIDS
jgi:hypothetical protein